MKAYLRDILLGAALITVFLLGIALGAFLSEDAPSCPAVLREHAAIVYDYPEPLDEDDIAFLRDVCGMKRR